MSTSAPITNERFCVLTACHSETPAASGVVDVPVSGRGELGSRGGKDLDRGAIIQRKCAVRSRLREPDVHQFPKLVGPFVREVVDLGSIHVPGLEQSIEEPEILFISCEAIDAPHEIDDFRIRQPPADNLVAPKPNPTGEHRVAILVPVGEQRVGVFRQPAKNQRIAVVPGQTEPRLPHQLAVDILPAHAALLDKFCRAEKT
jgi:hypothetical protein